MPEDIQDEYEEKIRSAEEVARRCLALYAVIATGHEGPRGELIDWLRRENLWEAVSPVEASFLQSDTPTQQQRVNATWRTEALGPLLWSLGLVPELPPPTGLCDVQALRRVLPPLMGLVAEWLSAAHLRPDSEIREANETVYQTHWAVRDARLNGKPVPQSFHPGVVQERHYALNWLIGYGGQDWDNISTDT
ncbi:MAG: DUF4272 domain-containing protein [Verrucomicrobia bacterium]|nr:DUF4272 domain-containing protein [Verrucomicrobiota bacterium]